MTDYSIEQDIAQNMRFYSDMRFKQLTLFMAWLTISGAGVMQYGDEKLVSDLNAKVFISMANMFFGAVLWVMEVRSSLYWAAHRDDFPNLWPRPKDPRMTWLNATNMVMALYIGNYLFWLICTFHWSGSPITKLCFSLFFAVLIIFTILNYMSLWSHVEKENGQAEQSGG